MATVLFRCGHDVYRPEYIDLGRPGLTSADVWPSTARSRCAHLPARSASGGGKSLVPRATLD